MSNAMKYIKALEAVGFERDQAEAQVQMVLDAIEGDLATKADLIVFQERIKNDFTHFEHRMENRFGDVDKRFVEIEFRIVTRLGLLIVSTVSIAVAVMTWLIKI